MILWSQQLKIINDSFYSFEAGKKVHVPIAEKIRKQGPTFLRTGIHESMTASNFKVHVLNALYVKQPQSILKLLERLNEKDPELFSTSRKLAKDLKTYNFLIKSDYEKLKEIVDDSENIWNEYSNDRIHKFTLHRLYKNKKFKPFDRRSKREIQVLEALMSNFNIDYKDD